LSPGTQKIVPWRSEPKRDFGQRAFGFRATKHKCLDKNFPNFLDRITLPDKISPGRTENWGPGAQFFGSWGSG